MFLPGRPFQPSLMFASKARAYQEKTWFHDTHNNDIQNDIKGLIVTLSITGHYHYADCCVSYVQCCVQFIVMLNVIVLNVLMMSVVMLNVILLSVLM